MVIRPATAADLDAICDIADEIAALHHQHAATIFLPPPGAVRDRAYWLASISTVEATMLVACTPGATAQGPERITGFISARLFDTTAVTFLQPRKSCQIGTVVVAAAHQRQGVGEQLMRAIEAWAAAHRAADVQLQVFAFNHTAAAFYAALGYAVQSHTLSRAV